MEIYVNYVQLLKSQALYYNMVDLFDKISKEITFPWVRNNENVK